VIALAPGREEEVVRAWARAGFERFPSLVVHVGGAPRSVSVGKGQFGIETAGGEASGGTAAGISRGVAGGVAGGVK
jgi:hypothetical protein